MWQKTATLEKPASTKPTSKSKAEVASDPGDQTQTQTQTQTSKSVSMETIRLRAYQKWEAAGNPAGDGTRFWLEAERELSQGN